MATKIATVDLEKSFIWWVTLLQQKNHFVSLSPFPLPQGDIVLVSEEFDDGWMRGLRLGDLEVRKSQAIDIIV